MTNDRTIEKNKNNPSTYFENKHTYIVLSVMIDYVNAKEYVRNRKKYQIIYRIYNQMKFF